MEQKNQDENILDNLKEKMKMKMKMKMMKFMKIKNHQKYQYDLCQNIINH